MFRAVFLATVQFSVAALFTIDCAAHPTDTISDSLYADRAFCMLVSFFIWLHLALVALNSTALVGAFAGVAAAGWFLVVAFDNRTGSILHAAGVVVFTVAAAIAAGAAFPKLIPAVAADLALAVAYMVLSVTHSAQGTAPVQRAAFAGLVVFLVGAVQWGYDANST
jgi:hypothetical protein